MQRFILIITNEGLDAVMPISNDPGAASIGKKADIILTFEQEKNPKNIHSREKSNLMAKIFQNHPELKGGGADPQEYAMFNLRANFAGDGAKKYFIGMNKDDMKKVQQSGQKEGAFHILDILITGKTELGKFKDDGTEETITGINLNKDWSDESKTSAKRRRRIFYNYLVKAWDDEPDEI